MITITGLNVEQVALLDTMWAIADIEEYMEWKCAQDEETMNMIDTLEEMVMWAELDEIEESECGQAKKMLDKIAKLR